MHILSYLNAFVKYKLMFLYSQLMLQPFCDWLSVMCPLTSDERILFEVAGQHEAKEDGESQDKEVSGRVEVYKL